MYLFHAGRGAKGTGRHTRKGDNTDNIGMIFNFVVTDTVDLLYTFKGGFIVIKHRIPEIVVPNLDGFEVLHPFFCIIRKSEYISTLSLSLSLSLSLLQLKPYVSYKTPYVVAKPITAEDILSIVQPLDSVIANEDTSASSKVSS